MTTPMPSSMLPRYLSEIISLSLCKSESKVSKGHEVAEVMRPSKSYVEEALDDQN